MTGRELATALLALPNPDLPIEVGYGCEGTNIATIVMEAKADAYYDEDFLPPNEEGVSMPKPDVKWDRRAIWIE